MSRSSRTSSNLRSAEFEVIKEVTDNKRKRISDSINEEDEEDRSLNIYSDLPVSSCYHRVDFTCTEKELNNFNSLSKDARNQCTKTISRLFIFKGTRNEMISRSSISDLLGKIDKVYKSHIK